MRTRAIIAAIAFLVAAAVPAAAASWRDQPGTLTVTVDTAAGTYTYHGTGFDPAATASGIYINECRPGCTASFLAEPADGDGEFEITVPTFGIPGNYVGWAIARVCPGNPNKPCDPVASNTKTVEIDRVEFVIP